MMPAFLCHVPVLLLVAANPAAKDTVFLSDQQHRILYKQQGWGQLGIDQCAHALHQNGPAIQIGKKEYKKGLGHHAPGEMIVQLSEEFAAFESDIGLQALPACGGSVVFKVFVDDVEKFDSGVMKTDTPAKHVSIPVEGATELRLVVTDAGDGLTCDCADWADAKLIRSHQQHTPAPQSMLDVAPFAELVTCDPERTQGATATRIQEYRAEDVFLETPLAVDKEGVYRLKDTPAGACIGLRWLERRMIRDVGIDFKGPVPDRAGVKVQCWVGGSLWQGNWKTLGGEMEAVDHGLRSKIDWSSVPEAGGATRKIRWLFPPGQNLDVRSLTALTPTPLSTADLRITVAKPAAGQKGIVSIYNGRIVGEDTLSSGTTPQQVTWPLDQPLSLKVQHTRPRPWKTDRTVLRFQLPDGIFPVALDDVLKDGGIYVRGAGLFVSRGDMNRDLDGFLGTIKDRKTVLQRVREMPDQTFAQAIGHVHNPKQDAQPMLLSLACDNNKFIAQRSGVIDFDLPDAPARKSKKNTSARLTPKFGAGSNQKVRRFLEEGWLPAPVLEVLEDGVTYRQRTFVVAASPKGHPVCVVEFSAEAPAGKQGQIELQFEGDTEKHDRADEVEMKKIVWKGRRLAQTGALDAQLGFELTPGKAMRISWPAGLATGRVFRVFLESSASAGDAAGGVPGDFAAFRKYWTDLLATTMQADLPDPLLSNVIKASQVHCLLAARNEDDGKRIAPWIGSMSYGPLESESNSIIRAMDFWGHHEFAQRSLDFFIGKYSPNGMLTTGYTLMGTGWHLWTLGEHFQLTRDKKWLESVAPRVAKVCDWIVLQRKKSMQELPTGRPPEYGLAPPGVMADWNAYAYYFCFNGYYDKGLFEAARALSAIGYQGADSLLSEAKSYREDILRAYHWAQARMPVYPLKDGTSVAGYPSQLTAPGPTNNFFPGEDGNRSWCYDVELGAHQIVPQGILDAKSREVGDMMDHMEDVQFLSEGWFDYSAERNEKDWFNLGGFAKVQPYYCRNMEIYALRDDVKPFIRSYFNTIPSLLGLETLSFQEHFAGVAAWNKTHETGYFLYYSRLMLVQERGDELWLMPFVTNNWLKDGDTISVKNAPTFFGPVSYEVKSNVNQKRIEASVTWPTRQKPKSIALRVRHPEGAAIKNVSVQPGGGGKAVVRRDANDPDVIYLDESDPTAHVLIEY